MSGSPGSTALARTARFAQFLRAAVAIRSRPVTEVSKYPTVMWFADLPVGLDLLRSPLLDNGWGEDDVRWLSVSRVPEPDVPAVPRSCTPWLNDVVLTDPAMPPALVSRTEIDAAGQPTEVPPPDEVRDCWASFVTESWTPWAERARVARLVKPVYQELFTVHQQLQGRDDAYDLFIGLGLLHARTREGALRRHLLAFPAELTFDSHTGVLTVQPSADFETARTEFDFLQTHGRVVLQKRMGEFAPQIEEIGAAIGNRTEIGRLVAAMAHSLEAEAAYVDDGLQPHEAPPFQVRASFAPALILRPRTTRSLDALLETIEQDTTGENPKVAATMLTAPWRRLVEDEGAWVDGGEQAQRLGARVSGEIPHFPLPSNEEQSRIIRHASGTAGVVVQGPPGTGKSHTIANLISHYLATGRRVLVTAEKAQALQVLKDKLPTELRALCVSLLGASSASDKDLERSVKGILNRHQETEDPGVFARQASNLEAELAHAEAMLGAHERVLHDARQAETVTMSPVPGYSGTRAAIARRLRDEQPTIGWISDELPHESPCPTFAAGWSALASYHASLDEDMRLALSKRWAELPFSAEVAVEVVEDIALARAALASGSSPAVSTPECLPLTDLDTLASWLVDLQQIGGVVSPGETDWMEDLRRAVLRQDIIKWEVLRGEATEAADRFTDAVAEETTAVEVAGDRSRAQARRDLTRLSNHYRDGGRRRVLAFFKPATVRETEWVEQQVTVEGSPLSTPSDVERARRAFDGWTALDAAWRAWGDWTGDRGASPKQQIALLRRRLTTLNSHLDVGRRVTGFSAVARAWLAGAAAAGTSTSALLASCQWRVAILRLATTLQRRDDLVSLLRPACAAPDATSGLINLRDGLAAESRDRVTAALAEHESERQQRERHAPYLRFCSDLLVLAPRLADRIRDHQGTPAMAEQFSQMEAAWAHRCTASWLNTVLSKERIAATERAARNERARIQELRADITTAKAWHHALARIDDRKRSALVGWTTAVASIPKTGLSVFRKRAVARSFLGRCLDTIPAWVVSLGRLYETVDARPGLFDIAVVDEASQCSLESLVLFYLAKQVIVVGDDKQISPTVVGVKDGEVERLASAYLPDFGDRGLFTIDSSLFGHARRYLSASVPLREHFRSVSEIIRFSNELCYADNPLIPLRAPGRDRLEPLRPVFVPDGVRHGDVNEAEALAIVDQIARCHADTAYEDCDFGVICLQGEDQASRIQHLLLERLGPSVFGERKLRCGNPYAFQGDERDVIFLSMVAATNTTNATLTTGTFEQRFNVAMSRARDQAWLFHSVREQDLGPLCLRRRVLDFFYQAPEQFVGGVSVDLPQLRLLALRADRMIERPPHPFESWFELDVALSLTAKGYRLSAQVQIAKRRIDLVVEGDGVRLAVECDGEAWHGPDRYLEDLHRQRQLERAGLRFARVRESLFYSDESRAVQEVVTACEELEIEPGGHRTTRTPSSPRADVAGTSTLPPTPRVVGDNAPPTSTYVDATLMDPATVDTLLTTSPVDGLPLDIVAPGLLTLPDGPFSGYSAKDYPDPRSAAPANVRDAVLDIVSQDGPLPKASIYRLYRDGCPKVERAGKYLRQAVNRAIASLERAGRIETRDEGVDKAPEEVVVRLAGTSWVRIRPAGGRSLDDVPHSELVERLRSTCGGVAPVAVEERLALFRQVVRDYGVLQLRQSALPRLERALNLIASSPAR
jgi:very-short-patch-repair endonuclease